MCMKVLMAMAAVVPLQRSVACSQNHVPFLLMSVVYVLGQLKMLFLLYVSSN